ncbi:hypothetical protein H9650_00460 [Psychrobacillus sp. Sa2BUA9]|uniref:ABC transporter permease n=1 Tax=Psychrobacillus faecigallinarum TaxID=2762235 RepID=A0ABR8R454_9BACI|nr:hypothetical protein [Psychrobacillus faecigallinarum]MBD7942570.1 hypothetical protein [Psychrobacillus faecigallinarum]
MIYFLGTSKEYLFFNLFISMALTYLLTAYFAVSVVFNQRDFNILSSLPISPKQIVKAKIISGLAFPIIIVGTLQIPIYFFLFYKYEIWEIVRAVIILTLINVMTALFLLFILSFSNRFRRLYSSSLLYFVTNTLLVVLIGVSPIMYFFEIINTDIMSLQFSSMSDIITTLSSSLKMYYSFSIQEPLIKVIVTPLLFKVSMIDFLVIVSSLMVICVLFFISTVKNTAVNYYKNGLLENSVENSVENMPKVKIYKTENIWSYYLQREWWIIQSEPYFKLQVILSLFLAPLFTFIFLIVAQMDLLKTGWLIDKELYIFGYMILFVSCVNNISGTPYSREGKNYAFSIVLPLDRRMVFLSKVATSSFISIASVVISYIIYLLFGRTDILSLLLLFITLVLIICYNLLSPIHDMRHPLVNWKTPSEAVKSNPNVLISLVSGSPILIFIAICHVWLLVLNVSQWIVAIIIALLTVAITMFTFIKVMRSI